MPWAETEPMKERARFVAEAERGHYSMTELCRRFGVSRKTGYKILERWLSEGPDGLSDRSRAPRHCPHRIEETVARAIVEARRKHPRALGLETQAPNDVWTADFKGHFRTCGGCGWASCTSGSDRPAPRRTAPTTACTAR